MNLFDFLTLINLAIAIRCLWARRPCLFIIAANFLMTLRALSNIQEFGQPGSQAFLPNYLFHDPFLSTAGSLFLMSTGILAIGALAPAPQSLTHTSFQPLPRWAIAAAIVVFGGNILATKTIFETSYAGAGYANTTLNLSGGIKVLAGAVLLYSIYRAMFARKLSRWFSFGLVFALFVVSDFVRGATGIATGFIVVAAIMFLHDKARPFRTYVAMLGALMAMVLFAAAIRGIRHHASESDGMSFGEAVTIILSQEDNRERQAQGVESSGNGTQYAAHMLETISLYDSGHSRQWLSIYAPLEYTFKPTILQSIFGWTRTNQGAAWELAEHFPHGGGIFVLGELYWNGGYLCLILVLGGIVLVSYLCDTRFDKNSFWLFLFCNLAPPLLMGMGYGFAQVSRGLITGLIFSGAYALVYRRRTRQVRQWAPAPSEG